MSDPADPNPTVDTSSVPPDSVRVAEPTTIDHVPGLANTTGPHAGADEPAGDLPAVPGY
jgi:hypothetical protein